MKKKLLILTSLAILFSIPALVIGAHKADASYLSNFCSASGIHGLSPCQGYFTGKNCQNASDKCFNSSYNVNEYNVEWYGMAVSSAIGFEQAVGGDLAGKPINSLQDKCGAAFIIDTMLGSPGPNTNGCSSNINYINNNGLFAKWQNLVQEYANNPPQGYGVNWNASVTLSGPNSGWSQDIEDDIVHNSVPFCSNNVCDGGPGSTISAIKFYWPGGQFEIERNCANLVGTITQLPSIPTKIHQPPSGCVQTQNGSTLSVCCTNNGSNPSAYYTISGGFDGTVPGPNSFPANNPSPRSNIGPPQYQLTSSNALGGSPQSTGQTFDYQTGSNISPMFINPYTAGTVSWSGSETATYQAYTIISYQYDNPNYPSSSSQQYLTGSYNSPYQNPPSPIPTGYLVLSRQKVSPPTDTIDFGQVSTPSSAPCVTMSCGSTSISPALAPDPLDPYMHFEITASVINNYGVTPSGTMNLQINPYVSGVSQQGMSYSSGKTTTALFNPLGPTGNTGVYQYTWSSSGPNADQNCGPQTFQVVDLPYLRVFGGDVMAGMGPQYNISGFSSCVSDSQAGVYSWNWDGAFGSYAGAGSQYAVQAMGQIDGLASAQESKPPTALSFANNPSDGPFGGYFGGVSNSCNFTRGINVPASTTSTNIGFTTVTPNGEPTIVYVKDHNVYISGNIIYVGNWTTPASIPDYRLIVVGGDIYIGANVSTLDGLYVAEPDNGQGGTIFTCASGLGTVVSPSPDSNYYNTCNNKLTVNGAFVAQQVEFLRTYGSLGQAASRDSSTSSYAGEVFNYTPALWLPRGSNNTQSALDAITGLPPIL